MNDKRIYISGAIAHHDIVDAVEINKFGCSPKTATAFCLPKNLPI